MSKVKAHFVKIIRHFLNFHRIDIISSEYFLRTTWDIFRTFSSKINEIIIKKMKMKKFLTRENIFFFARAEKRT